MSEKTSVVCECSYVPGDSGHELHCPVREEALQNEFPYGYDTCLPSLGKTCGNCNRCQTSKTLLLAKMRRMLGVDHLDAVHLDVVNMLLGPDLGHLTAAALKETEDLMDLLRFTR